MSTKTELTYGGRPVVVVKTGIFLTLVEYRDLFKSLPRGTCPGDATNRQFHVLTSALNASDQWVLN